MKLSLGGGHPVCVRTRNARSVSSASGTQGQALFIATCCGNAKAAVDILIPAVLNLNTPTHFAGRFKKRRPVK